MGSAIKGREEIPMRLQKILFSALTVCLFVGASSVALAKSAKDTKDTILDTLEHTDGSQAVVAAIRVVDGDGVCGDPIEQLLDNKKEQLVFFAPSNGGFAKFLKLPGDGFDGMDTDAIVLAFPGLLNKIELTSADLCDVLRNHVAATKDAKKLTARKLLQQGSITVADGGLFPIAVGPVGTSIDYASNLTERDLFTVNGVIHYIDNVLVEPEPPEVGPSPSDICTTVDACAVAGPSRNDCQIFVLACGAAGLETEDCAQGATLICIETELGGLPPR
jgi:uncharacterized surface protein with fasciclin (FAS1) repeats